MSYLIHRVAECLLIEVGITCAPGRPYLKIDIGIFLVAQAGVAPLKEIELPTFPILSGRDNT